MIKPIAGLVAGIALLWGTQAFAGTYIVNSESDAPDAVPGDGICDILPPGDPTPPVCTLRAAIAQANAQPDASAVYIPAGFHIVLLGPLPVITQPLDISGLPADDVADFAVVDGNHAHQPFRVQLAEVAIRNLRVVNGVSALAGSGGGGLHVGALSSVVVENVQFRGNAAQNNALGGGAILSHGALEVVRSDFEENSTTGNGGAIYHAATGTQDMMLRDSSIRRTRTDAATGEAVYIAPGATLEVVNSLIDGSDNQPGATERGGVLAVEAERVELRNATFVNFTRRALQVQMGEGGVLSVQNSILAGSDAGDCVVGSAGDGTVSFGYNLIEDDTCAIHSGSHVVTGPPALALLQTDDGSFVRYRMPQFPGSAVDAASPGPEDACESTDQRGTPRSLDDDGDGVARCDLGAVEGTNALTQVFQVGTSVDTVDTDPGDGVCANSAGSCSLRAAVMEANAKPGPDVIRFHPLNMTLTLADAADASGGDLDITEALLVEGSFGAHGRPITVLQQTEAGERHFEVNAPSDQPVVFRGLRLSGGDTTNVSGGSIRITGGADVQIDRVEFFDNRSDDFGGALSLVDGHLAMTGSDLHHNGTGTSGPALFVGGNGTAEVHASSFWANEDDTSLRDTIYVAPGGTLELRNSTVAFNHGGVTGHFATSLRIEQSTIAFNEDRGIAAFFQDPGFDHFRLSASILAGNALDDCGFNSPQLADLIEVNLWNMVQDGSVCSSGANNVVADPLLAFAAGATPLLQPPGQLSRVLMPGVGPNGISPALDRVPVGPSCLAVDQLGVSRPRDLSWVANGDGPCDIGAVELKLSDVIFRSDFESPGIAGA